MKSKAFTIVELLVVIVIISILAALLFPVLTQAKLSAKGSATIEYLRQNFLAIEMYQAGSDLLPRGLSDTSLYSLKKDGELYDKARDAELARVRVADLLIPYVKDRRIFRSARSPEVPALRAMFGNDYFGWRWDDARAMFGPGPSYNPSSATSMMEFLDYEAPGVGTGLTACLYESGAAKMTPRLDCLAGIRDLAFE
jgi:prepilin-type N-terminal cleavage/methylation domain-containing protein